MLGEIARQRLAQDVLLVLLGEQLRLVEAVDARQAKAPPAAAARARPRLTLELARRRRARSPSECCRGDRQHAFASISSASTRTTADGVAARRVTSTRAGSDQRRGAALHEVALRILGLDVHRCERDSAAACAPAGWNPQAARAHAQAERERSAAATLVTDARAHTTMLTSLPRHEDHLADRGLPAMNFCTFSSASAAARTRLVRAPAAREMRPRSLPLTCTTISTASCASAAAIGLAASARRCSALARARALATAHGRHAARWATGTAPRSPAPRAARRGPAAPASVEARRSRSAAPSPRRSAVLNVRRRPMSSVDLGQRLVRQAPQLALLRRSGRRRSRARRRHGAAARRARAPPSTAGAGSGARPARPRPTTRASARAAR